MAGTKSTKRGRSIWLTVLLATTAIGGLVTIAPLRAQPVPDAGQAQAFDIAPQPLVEGLILFAKQSGYQVSAATSLTQNLRGSSVKGRMNALQALSTLLDGTGLTYRINGAMVALERAPQSASAIALGPLRVEAQGAAPALGGNLRGPGNDPVADRLNPPTSIGSKTPVSQREIPQSISVITQERIESQNLFNLEDAIRQTPGLVVRTGDSERFMFYARGFPVDQFQYDGIPTVNANSATSPSLLMYDRVEVLRGPSGLFNGIGGEGGSINLVRKRAPGDLTASASLSAGSRDNFRGEADAGGALNGSGSIRARGAISYQDQDLVEDTTYRKDFQLFGTVEADLDDSTSLRIGAARQELRQRAAWMGYPVYSDYSFIDIPRSRYLGAPWGRDVYRTTTEYAELKHETSGGWTLKATSNFLQHRNGLLTSSINGPVDPGTGDFPMAVSASRWNEDQYGADTYASGPFALFGRTHNLTLGTNFQSYIEDQSGHNGDSFLNNIFNPVSIAAPPSTPNASIYRNSQQYGLYGNARLNVSDEISVVLGGRISWVRSQFDYNFPSGIDRYHDKYDAKATPFAGLVWDIDSTLTAYASYAQVFTPQFTRDAAGNIFKPITGSQYEAGIKGEYFGGRLNTSAALFRILDNNRTKEDPRFPGQFISIAQGKARSQGLELQASGEVARGLTLLAGYTYTETKYDDDSRNANGDFETFAPRHLFKAQLDYTLPGDLERWSVGGGVQAQSKTFVYDMYGGGTVTQGFYATADLRATFKATDHVAISLNGTNITNQRYWETLGGLYGGNFLGNPRAVVATLRWTY